MTLGALQDGAGARPMIETRGLGKIFRPPGGLRELARGRLHGPPVTALAGVDLRVRAGEIVCVMGENGAGKTTLLRILGGLLLPSSGQVTVAGLDAATAGDGLRRQVAILLGEERGFHGQITGRETLHYFGALHGFSPGDARARAAAWLERVGLGDAADRRVATYSRGMKQRLAIARALLGDAPVLLLDEPTLGLDPRGALELRRFLRDTIIREAGRTALIGSNDPAEARVLSDRVLVLRGGRVAAEVAPADAEAALVDAAGEATS